MACCEMSLSKRHWCVIGTVAAVCVLSGLADFASKEWALSQTKASLIPVIPGVFTVMVPPLRNFSAGSLIPGMNLGPLAAAAGHATIVIPVLLCIAAVVWMIRVERSAIPMTMLEQVGFGMLLGGTFSNLYDRVVRHCVIDFMHLSMFDFWLWNVADVVICLGLFFVGLDALRLRRLLRTKAPEVAGLSGSQVNT